VLHDEIDPIQEGAVEVAARLAIQEVNATVLATLATEAQDRLAPSGEIAEELLALAERLGDDPVTTSQAIDNELARLTPALDGTATVLSRLELEDDGALEQLEETRMAAATVVDRAEGLDETATSDQIDELATAVVALADHLDETIVLDPEVLVRPFESSTENVLTESIRPNDYFTPASLALLLQHLALTFAALSLVRDRRTGLFELMRVGPLSSIEIVLGKIFAYLLVGTIVGAALICGAVFGLGVTFTGSIGWLVVVVVGVLLASLALGMLLATLAATESQAVQYAMLALLGGLFFSGFILPISGLSYPVKLVSFLLPVTYGIATLQDIMLRGSTPAPWALTGLAALVAVYGAIAVLGLRRRLRTGGVTS
jgi:ABC-2 type transport system permease protein